MIAILAFGSLLDDPGKELATAMVEKRPTETPFAVEFARLSASRGGAPTLAPVDSGGGTVRASFLVLDNDVSLQEAKDMLWRRETNKVANQ